jgi:tRNA-2-methylthio-N6-dimethylallyladenosine synthase
MKIYIETFGCQMNRLDSELAASALAEAGHELVRSRRQADVVLYNTCCVRQHAEDKVHSRLGADRQRGQDGAGPAVIGVMGCMAQGLGRELLARHPHVNLLCGPGQLAALADLVESASRGAQAVALDPPRLAKPPRLDPRQVDRLDCSRRVDLSPHPAQAFVRVSQGCDKFCTYCVVPFVRGPQVSRDPARIVEEVRRLLDSGRSQITLLGQTVNSYRWEDGGSPVSFAGLLERLAALAGVRRLRFVTSHPVDLGDDLLAAMRDLPNVCRYLHIPAQSGSDAVLRRMNRHYRRAQYDDLIDRARAFMPDVVLAGDFIVGFPGETDADHAASAELIRRGGYRNSFIFKYSPRPGTAAARTLSDDVPMAVKQRRNRELLAVQAQVSLEHNRRLVGSTVELLVEGVAPRASKQPSAAPPGQTQLLGRTRGDHIVVFDAPDRLVGRYVQALIRDATALTLFGQFVRED